MTSPRAARAFRIFAWSVVLYHLAVIVWGAFVRATGSGAGCGEHWPLCNGVVLPVSPTVATLIEFSHRVTSGIAVGSVAVLLFFAFRLFPARHLVRRAAAAALVFEFMEAVIGAAIVLLGEVARNTSTGRAWFLSVHLINTLLLMAALSLAAWAAAKSAPTWNRAAAELRPAFACAAAGILFLAVSGAIAALGDTLFRATSLAEGFQRDFAAGAHPFLRLRVIHPFLAGIVAIGLGLLCYRVVVRQINARACQLAYGLSVLVAVQMAAGAINLALLAPVPLQLVHLLIADILWIAFVLLAAEALSTDAAAARPPARAPELALRDF